MCYLLGPLILHLGYTPLLFCGYLYFIGTPRLTYGHEQGQYGTLTERITYVFYYNNNTAIYKQYTTYIYCWSTLRTRLLCTSSVVHCKRIHRHLITALFGGQPTISPSCKQQATSGKFFYCVGLTDIIYHAQQLLIHQREATCSRINNCNSRLVIVQLYVIHSL